MLMEIDIRYPNFEEGYWHDKEENKMLRDEKNKWRGAIIAETRKANELKKERDILKTENKNLQYKYNVLERKYWEAQRTIDKYAAENEELKKQYMEASNDISLYKYEYDLFKKDLTRWREMYYDLQKERDELENKLLDTEDKLEETERELKGTKRYMEGYQNLYIEEVLKHKESDDGDEEKTLDIYDLEDSDGEDDDNKS